MKSKHIQAYMDCARRFAELSSAIRLQVGCVIVKNDTIIGIGYNGTPSGWTNDCEDKIYESDETNHDEKDYPYGEDVLGEYKKYRLVTRPEVLHAETNAIAKVAKSTFSSEGADLFVTHAPCLSCATVIYQSGIQSVYYNKMYRTDDGIKFLKKAGVKIENV